MQVDLRESWWIGGVEIPTRLVLARMAGVSVRAFRRQGRRYGAGLVCSEMVSCAGLEHRNERTLGYLRVAGDEHPLAIQIFGSEPHAMAEAARPQERTPRLPPRRAPPRRGRRRDADAAPPVGPPDVHRRSRPRADGR